MLRLAFRHDGRRSIASPCDGITYHILRLSPTKNARVARVITTMPHDVAVVVNGTRVSLGSARSFGEAERLALRDLAYRLSSRRTSDEVSVLSRQYS